MTRALTLLALLCGGGCVFDRMGVVPPDTAGAPDVAALDARQADAPPVDQRALDGPGLDTRRDSPALDLPQKDLPHKDLPVPDTKPPPPDLPTYHPVTSTQIISALWQVTVPCIDNTGAVDGADIRIVDSYAIAMYNGSVTLNSAPPGSGTAAWVGGRPSVIVVFDPNACGTEDPISNDGAWVSAGLLIRGATLDAQQRLVLESGVTVADIDLLDVDSVGKFEGSSDFATPTDSGLASYKQLVQPVNAAKNAILQVAKN